MESNTSYVCAKRLRTFSDLSDSPIAAPLPAAPFDSLDHTPQLTGWQA